MAGDGVRGRSGRNFSGPSDDGAHAHPALPRAALVAAERGVGSHRSAAIVAGENDQGGIVEAEIGNGLEDLPEAPVEFLHPIPEEPVGGFPAELVAGIEREMDGGVGEIEKEGLAVGRRQVLQRLFGVAAGDGGLSILADAFDDRAVPEKGKGRLVVSPEPGFIPWWSGSGVGRA